MYGSAGHRRVGRGLARTAAMAVGVSGMLVLAPHAHGVERGQAAAVYGGYSCNGGLAGTGQHDSDWTLTGVPTTFYVNEEPKKVTADISYRLPDAESEKFRGPVLGLGMIQGWMQPVVEANGSPLEVIELASTKKDMEYTGRISLPFSGPVFTIPTQTTPGTLDIRVPSYRMPISDWYAGGNTNSPTRDVTYGCTPVGGTAPFLGSYVVKSRSQTGLEITPSRGVYVSEQATASATVTVDGGTAEGRVDFEIDGQVMAAARVGVDGRAVATLPADLTPGNKPLVARFVPTDAVHYDASVSNTVNLKVSDQAATTTTVSMRDSVLQPGATGQVTVQVDGTTDQPVLGQVRLHVGQASWTTPVEQGQATFNLPPLPMGRHEVRAEYLAVPGANASSASTPAVLRVLGTSSVQIRRPDPVGVNTPGTLVATVSAEGGVARGVVTFRVGGYTLNAHVVDGTATVEVPALPAGSFPAQADFVPAEGLDVASATSGGVSYVVSSRPLPGQVATPTQVKATLTRASVAHGSTAVLSASVSPTAPGTLTVQVGGTRRQFRVNGGVVTMTLPTLAPGQHTVVTSFSPDNASAFRASTATTVLTVGKAASRTGVKVKVKKSRTATKTLVVNVKVRSAVAATGKVRVVVTATKAKKRVLTLTVRQGVARVVLPKVKGTKVAVTATYLGSKTVAASAKKKTIRIKAGR